jgi:hypothetical protein
LWMSIRLVLGNWIARTISFSFSDRMDNVLKDHNYPTFAFFWLRWGS